MMFSDKENLAILTDLLIKHGICYAVVCPGSQNAPIINNLLEADIMCFPVVDERSAGFYALGLSLATDRAVAVCVTSGSALLNLLPAVAEAAYRHCGIVVISADRPAERIGQLAGQTIPQVGALEPFASISVDLSDLPSCNRLVNEALILATGHPQKVVHINVPLDEPLFNYNQTHLPGERKIEFVAPDLTPSPEVIARVKDRLARARNPLVILGQLHPNRALTKAIRRLGSHLSVWCDTLSCGELACDIEELLLKDDPHPDFILFAGENLVSKNLTRHLLKSPDCESWVISIDGAIHDTFRNLSLVIHADPVAFFTKLAAEYPADKPLNAIPAPLPPEITSLSSSAAVGLLEAEIAKSNSHWHFHYANSTAIRLGNRFSRHYNYVNRGVNGIEGSLSTAAGFSLALPGDKIACIIGDLSFFYDCNALWQSELKGNLRILLLNNGGGGIFRNVPGMPDDINCSRYVMGSHNATARGICESYNVAYCKVDQIDQLTDAIQWLVSGDSLRPMLVELIVEQ